MAQALSTYFFDLRHITGLTGTDLELNATSARGFAAGQPMWQYDAQGIKLFTLIQNRNSAAGSFTRGQLISRIGGNTGVVIASVSTGTTTQVAHNTNSLTTNQFVGSICYLASTGSTAIATPEGESGIVVSNTTVAININPLYPFSTTPGAGLLAQLISTYNTEWSAAGDLSNVVMGVCVPQGGISTGNFGFVQSYGPCGRASKDLAVTGSVFLTGSQLAAGTATGALVVSTAGALANLTVARAMAPASSVATDAMAFLNCSQLFSNVSTASTNVI